MRRSVPPPPGFSRVRVGGGGAVVVARTEVVDAVAGALDGRTLHEWAALRDDARPLHGRGVAFGVSLGGVGPVVVRHNRHGGLLAPLTGDRFVRPSRAPYELATSLRLAAAGVPTPDVVAYVLYPAGPLLCRSDVVTRLVAPSMDLAELLRDSGRDAAAVGAALEAAAALVALLSAAGARHHDLNLKNVLLVRGDGSAAGAVLEAYVLDVDRVELGGRPADVLERNLARLVRSARKWMATGTMPITESDLSRLRASARARLVRGRGDPGAHAA